MSTVVCLHKVQKSCERQDEHPGAYQPEVEAALIYIFIFTLELCVLLIAMCSLRIMIHCAAVQSFLASFFLTHKLHSNQPCYQLNQ